MRRLLRLFRQARRVVDPKLARRLGLVAVASIVVSALDAVGILLLIPLIEALASGAATSEATIPWVGEISITALLAAVIIFFIGKSVGMAAIRWWSTGVILAASAATA